MRAPLFTAIGLCAALIGCSSTGPSAPDADEIGNLQINVQGVPEGAQAMILVQGPEGFSREIEGSIEWSDLLPGEYTLAAESIRTSQGDYTPTPAWQQLELLSGRKTIANVSYGPLSNSTLDLSIAAAYLVQGVQRLDGSVPLVAGREAMLRVFVVANEAAQLRPALRVTLRDGQGNPLRNELIAAPSNTLRLDVDQSDLSASWNLLIEGRHLLPGLRLSLEVDPANAIAESNESNNRWPATAEAELDVRAVDDLQIRFVPVHQTTTGLTGDVNAGNVDDFVDLARKLWPTAGYAADVHSVYSSSTPALQPDDGNAAWSSILREMWALRQVESPSVPRHYYGVVDVSYSNGIAGMAYVSAYSGVGRDLAFPGLRAIFPHELGHNLGLHHAACGVGGGDPAYPYPDGQIGVWGLDLELSLLKAPELVDVMSYCRDIWISDYNFELAFDWRLAAAKRATQTVGSTIEACYLVWGSLHDGGIELQPVVELDARAVLPRGGEFELELTRKDGETRSLRFDGVELSDGGRPGERHFAWLLPRADFTAASELQSVIVRGGGHGAMIAADPRPIAFEPRVAREADGAWIRWDGERRPLLVARDAESAEIVSFARGGSIFLPRSPSRLELITSDGARSERLIEY